MATPLSISSVTEALRQVIDPEFQRNLVELGMIRAVEVDGAAVYIDLQLTTPSCPRRNEFIAEITERVRGLPGVEEVAVELVCEGN
jgi:ATP-binding protein involved in chromosome partitioning